LQRHGNERRKGCPVNIKSKSDAKREGELVQKNTRETYPFFESCIGFVLAVEFGRGGFFHEGRVVQDVPLAGAAAAGLGGERVRTGGLGGGGGAAPDRGEQGGDLCVRGAGEGDSETEKHVWGGVYLEQATIRRNRAPHPTAPRPFTIPLPLTSTTPSGAAGGDGGEAIDVSGGSASAPPGNMPKGGESRPAAAAAAAALATALAEAAALSTPAV
jgi:hypothetical protein